VISFTDTVSLADELESVPVTAFPALQEVTKNIITAKRKYILCTLFSYVSRQRFALPALGHWLNPLWA
jgi:hypothetical protein